MKTCVAPRRSGMLRKVVPLSVLLIAACSYYQQEDDDGGKGSEAGQSRDIQVYAATTDRMSTRILFFEDGSPPTSPGQLVISYGQPKWKPEYAEGFDELTRGKRWRFGNNDWTSMDTNVTLDIAGETISPGHYYLLLERSQSDQWFLALLDPKRVREKKLDAFYVDDAPEGLRAPLEWTRAEETTEQLMVKLVPLEDDSNKARLEISWGNHRLTAKVEMDL